MFIFFFFLSFFLTLLEYLCRMHSSKLALLTLNFSSSLESSQRPLRRAGGSGWAQGGLGVTAKLPKPT